MRNRKFNFDEMMELHQKDPEMFEQRRNELLLDARERCSGPQRKALDNLQNELDQIRSKQPEHFMRVCFEGMSENLAMISAGWRRIEEIARELD